MSSERKFGAQMLSLYSKVEDGGANGGLWQNPGMDDVKEHALRQRLIEGGRGNGNQFPVFAQDINEEATWVLDPRSQAYGNWENVLMLLLLYTACITPYEVAFCDTKVGEPLFWINRVVDLCFAIDLGLNFNLGFFAKGSKMVLVTDRAEIRIKYFKGFFWVDFLSILPFEALSSSMIAFKLLRLLRLAKLTKIVRSMKIIQRWQVHWAINYSVVNLAMAMFVILAAMHWMSCLWFLLSQLKPGGTPGDSSDPTWVEAYVFKEDGRYTPQKNIENTYLYPMSLYHGTMTLSTIGYGDAVPTTQAERWTSLVFMQLFGGGLFAYVIAVATQIVAIMNKFQLEQNCFCDDLNDMADETYLPNELIVRGREFIIFGSRAWKQEYWMSLLNRMSPSLRADVVRALMLKYIDAHPCFQALDVAVRIELASVLEPVCYPNGELIVHSGPCDAIHFIITGVCAQYGTMYSAGEMFGVEAIMDSGRLSKPVRAVTDVNLFRLSREAVNKVRREDPKVDRAIRVWGIKRSFARDTRKVIKKLVPVAFDTKGNLRADYRERLDAATLSKVAWYRKVVDYLDIKYTLENFRTLQQRLINQDASLRACLKSYDELHAKAGRQQSKIKAALKLNNADMDAMVSLVKTAEASVAMNDLTDLMKDLGRHRMRPQRTTPRQVKG